MKYSIKAYANAEYGLKEQKAIITAESHEEAMAKAFRLFPEYEEIGVWSEDDGK